MEKNKTLLKICGIRSVEEIEELKGLDIDYIGCIFAKSPRQVNIEVASQITKIAHKNGKKVVGVFVNAMIRDIVRIVETLKIDVVQLHGNETAEYCEELGKALERIHKNYLNNLKNDVKSIKDKTAIWKSFAVKNKLPNINDYKSFIEYPLFETKGDKAGGNGKTFDWKTLEEVSPYSFILAGGISTENVEAAMSYRPAVVDVNSKVEIDDRKNKKLVEKEINKLETKDLSIYELIKNSIQNNGELPEDFKLPPKDPNGVPWADGAMDGVYIYHTVGNEEDIEALKSIVFQISEGKFEEAETNLDKLDFSMVSRTNSLLSWIIQEQKQINLNNLYEFASSRLVTTKNIEVIKFCLSVLAIMNVETDAETIEKVKILALSDEFTL